MPRRADRFNFYCEGSRQDTSLQLVPIRRWLQENFYTLDQIETLLRQRFIVAKKFKGRLYVATNPDRAPTDNPL